MGEPHRAFATARVRPQGQLWVLDDAARWTDDGRTAERSSHFAELAEQLGQGTVAAAGSRPCAVSGWSDELHAGGAAPRIRSAAAEGADGRG